MSEGPHLPAIAIVGMSCRFPGAPDPEAFWSLLREGREGIRRFSRDELLAAGVPAVDLADPGYVPARGVLEDVDRFDAAFFGLSLGEASLLDPQHRLWLECAWEALEEAGCNAGASNRAVGVFAGCRMSSYLLTNLIRDRRDAEALAVGDDPEAYRTLLANDKDMLATRTSYLLNLKGPSLTVQTACSSSLVAVAQACQALLTHQCDVALAGGVSIVLPLGRGYRHRPGGILSPDGHCRAFDARAQGTVLSDGVGAVTLKRLDDALAAGDAIHALIRGWAVNNDGAVKQGFTAPAIEGQEEVIALAQAVAGVDPRSIGYLEAHGTGTALGDPIEVTAAARAFGRGTADTGFCGLGSVKTNIGHTDAAAGIAGLIKAALALREGEIPASLHFERPNPAIDFAASPFRVVRELARWPGADAPRRAGVTSLGIGGTNCHVVLEEPPPRADRRHRRERRYARAWQRQRCWIDPPGAGNRHREFDDAPPNPLLGRRLWLPMSTEIRYESRLSCAALPLLGDHRLFGSVVVAAATDIALILSAVDDAFGAPGCTLENVAFLRPLVIPENGARVVQLVMTPGDDGWHSINVLSRDDAVARPREEDWTLHVTARVSMAPATASAVALASLRARCPEPTSGGEFYERLWGPGADTGAAFRWLRDLWRGDGEAVAIAAPPDPPGRSDAGLGACPLMPGLVEACFQTLFHGGRFETRDCDAGAAYVPVRIARFVLHRRAGALPLWCHGAADRRFPADAPLKSGVATIFDAEGSVVAEVDGFEVRALARSALAAGDADVDRLLYAVDWVPKDLATRAPAPSRQWLIDADDVATARGLVARLAARGVDASVAAIGAIASELGAGGTKPIGIACLRGFATLRNAESGFRLAMAERVGADLLRLAQAAAASARGSRLFIVTSRAQARDGDEPPARAELAVLWGLGRVLARELPDLGCTSVETGESAADLDALVDELLAEHSEREIVLRDRRRHCPRLAQLRRRRAAPRTHFAVVADATYLVTDGLSSQGLALAAWLVDRGARSMLLATAEPASAPDRPAALEREGATVRVCRHGTLAPDEAATAVVEALAGMPPLRGVIALNDLMDDGIVVGQTPDRLRAALHPALRAWALDSALRGIELDFYVCFSTSASVLGTAGQGSYAAAGALLDALARERRRRGEHGLAIAWGPWADAGKAAELPARQRNALRAQGWTPLPTGTALRCLEALLHADAVQAAVLDVDWRAYAAALAAPHPLLSTLVSTSDAASPRNAPTGASVVDPAQAQDVGALLPYVLSRTAEVLGVDAGRISVSDSVVALGLDSLAALVLSNRFQQDLGIGVPMAAIIESRDLGALATALQSRIHGEPPPAFRRRVSATGNAPGIADAAVD